MYSVIIPVYNGEDSLERTVQSALAQTVPAGEILILNDCSTDQSGAIAHRLAAAHPTVQVWDNPENKGVAQTRNRGFQLAQGDYVALLDADDCWRPTKMQEQLAKMEQTGCDFSYTGYTLHRPEAPDKEYRVPETVEFATLLIENVIGCSTVVLTSELAKNYTMSSAYSHEDYVLWLQLLQEGKKACGISHSLMDYAVSPDSRSGDKRKAAGERWRIYREFLHMSWFQSAVAFVRYALRGIRKHYR